MSLIFSDYVSECGNLWEEKKKRMSPFLSSTSSDFIHFAACTRQYHNREKKVFLNNSLEKGNLGEREEAVREGKSNTPSPRVS